MDEDFDHIQEEEELDYMSWRQESRNHRLPYLSSNKLYKLLFYIAHELTKYSS